MILGAIIIVSSFFVGNTSLSFDPNFSKTEYAPYFKTKAKGLFFTNKDQAPYRLKKIDRDGKDYLYLLEGLKSKPSQKPENHPHRKPTTVVPM